MVAVPDSVVDVVVEPPVVEVVDVVVEPPVVEVVEVVDVEPEPPVVEVVEVVDVEPPVVEVVELDVVVVVVAGGICDPPGRSPSKAPFTWLAYTNPSSWPPDPPAGTKSKSAHGATTLIASCAASRSIAVVASEKFKMVFSRRVSTAAELYCPACSYPPPFQYHMAWRQGEPTVQSTFPPLTFMIVLAPAGTSI